MENAYYSSGFFICCCAFWLAVICDIQFFSPGQQVLFIFNCVRIHPVAFIGEIGKEQLSETNTTNYASTSI